MAILVSLLRVESSFSVQSDESHLRRSLFVHNLIGYCTDVCCDPWTEETCYSQYTGQPETCSSLADGGCPCPEGQVKCGAVDGYPGI